MKNASAIVRVPQANSCRAAGRSGSVALKSAVGQAKPDPDARIKNKN